MQIGSPLSMPFTTAVPAQQKFAPAGGGNTAPAPATVFTQAMVQAKPAAGTAAAAAPPTAPAQPKVPPSTLPPEREAPSARSGPPQRLPADEVPHAKGWPVDSSPAAFDAPGSAASRLRNARAAMAESGKLRALPAVKPDPRPLPAESEPPLVIDGAADTADANGGSLVQLRPFAPPDCFGGPLTPLPVHQPPPVVASTVSNTTADGEEPLAQLLASPEVAPEAGAPTPTTARRIAAAGSDNTPGMAHEALLEAAQATHAAQAVQAATVPIAAPASAQSEAVTSTAASTAPATLAAATATANVVSATASAITAAAIGAELPGAGRLTRTEAAVANLYRGGASAESAAAVALPRAPTLLAVSANAASTPVALRSEGLRQATGEAAPAIVPESAPAAVAPDAARPAHREERTKAQAAIAGPTELPPANPPQAPPSTTAAESASPAVSPPVAGAAGREAEHRSAGAASDTASPLPLPGSTGVIALGAYQAAAAAVPAQARLSASPGSPDFAPQLGIQITTFVRDGIEHAQLHLNPAEMGPVSVRIQLDGQTAQVHLSADHALTRQALEASMPQLASQLSEAGLTLSGGGVFEQPRQGREAAAQGGSGEPGRSGRGDGERDRGQAQAAPVQPPMRRGVVDLVA